MPHSPSPTPRDPPSRTDDAPDATTPAKHTPRPVDLAEESAAGEEDPGAGMDVPVERSGGAT